MGMNGSNSICRSWSRLPLRVAGLTWKLLFFFFPKGITKNGWYYSVEMKSPRRWLGWSGGSKVTDFYDFTIPSTPASEWNRLPSWRNPSHFHFQGSWNPSPFSYFGIFLFFLKLTITPTTTKKSIDKLCCVFSLLLWIGNKYVSPFSLSQKSQ